MTNHFYKLVICGYMDYRIKAVLIHIKTLYKLIKVVPADADLVEGRNMLSLLRLYLINTWTNKCWLLYQ